MKELAKELLFFKKFVTPQIITVVYWVILFGLIITGFDYMTSGKLKLAKLLIGFGIIVFGAVAARIFCELLIVIFKINDTLKEMNSK